MDLFPGGVKEILRVLKSKAFYQHRFLDQVLALYESQTEKSSNDEMTPTLYLSTLFRNIKKDKTREVGEWCAKRLVTAYQECPSPSMVADLIGEGVLASYGLDYTRLYVRAQDFFLYPPKEQCIADQWVERVIYTTAQAVGREQFVFVDAGQWRSAVARVIVGEKQLLAMKVVPMKERVSVVRTHQDFDKLKQKILRVGYGK